MSEAPIPTTPGHDPTDQPTAPVPDPVSSAPVPGDTQNDFVSYEGPKTTIRVMGEALVTEQQRAETAEAALEAAQLDPLTGLPTRRAFEAAVERAFSSRAHPSQRRHDDESESSGPLGSSLLMLDLDLFKEVNDSHGHPSGDEVLKALANLLRAGLRPGDLAARLGGEEFAVLLNDISPEEVSLVAERLRATIADTPVELTEGGQVKITASIGIAPLHGTATYVDVYSKADKALYYAKVSGRNQVRSIGEVPSDFKVGKH